MESFHHKQLNELARLDWLRTLRTWCFALGFAALGFALVYVGGSGVANPKTWASAHAALAAAGGLRWLILPLMAAGVVLLVVGTLLCLFISKRETRSE